MRLIALPLVVAVSLSAAPPPDDSDVVVRAPNALPAEYWPCTGSVSVFNPEACRGITPPRAQPRPGDCRDRIQQVREDSGQPRLDRETASPDRPLLIAAVDKRVDGCAVMQMKGNVNDLRPIPQPSDGPGKLQPAN